MKMRTVKVLNRYYSHHNERVLERGEIAQEPEQHFRRYEPRGLVDLFVPPRPVAAPALPAPPTEPSPVDEAAKVAAEERRAARRAELEALLADEKTTKAQLVAALDQYTPGHEHSRRDNVPTLRAAVAALLGD